MGFIRHRTGNPEHLSFVESDHAGHTIQFLLPTSRDDNGCSFLDKPFRDRFTDPGIASRHHGYLAF
jgi:hypothetical protein